MMKDFYKHLVAAAVASLFVQVSATAQLVGNITPGGSMEICPGDSVTLTATFNADWSYRWQLNAAPIRGVDSNELVAKEPGTYTVGFQSVSNPAERGISSNTFTMTHTPGVAPFAIAANGPTSFCEGGSVELSFIPMAGVTYAWFRDNVDLGESGDVYQANVNGAYHVEGTIANGCPGRKSTNTVAVEVKTSPAGALIQEPDRNVFCEGDTIFLGVPNLIGVNFEWRRNNSEIVGNNSETLAVTQEGTYRVIMSNACGSDISANSIDLDHYPSIVPPTITVAENKTEACQGETLNLLLLQQTDVSYAWGFNGSAVGNNASTLTINEGGNYSVTISGQCESLASDILNIRYLPVPAAPTAVSDFNCGPGQVEMQASGSFSYEFYSDSNGNQVLDRNNSGFFRTPRINESTTYYLRGFTEQGCQSPLVSIAATIAPLPTVEAGDTKFISLGDSVFLDLLAEGATIFSWDPPTGLDNPGSRSPLASPAFDTQYFIEVFNDFGCKDGDWVDVRVQQPVIVYNTITPNNDGSNDFFVIENLETYPNHNLRIIDRWGAEVYFSENYQNDWDGSVDGEVLPNDTYYYIIEFNEKNKSSETGWIAVLK